MAKSSVNLALIVILDGQWSLPCDFPCFLCAANVGWEGKSSQNQELQKRLGVLPGKHWDGLRESRMVSMVSLA